MIASPVYLGADVAKASIDCRLLNQSFSIANSPAGFAKLGSRLKPLADRRIHVVVEATGGYQNAFVDYLHKHQILLSVVNPRQVRDFARSRGILAKTDRLDARVLADYGLTNSPTPDTPNPKHIQRLGALLAQRDCFVTERAIQKTRLHLIEEPLAALSNRAGYRFFPSRN